jgi:hypothetical protein
MAAAMPEKWDFTGYLDIDDDPVDKWRKIYGNIPDRIKQLILKLYNSKLAKPSDLKQINRLMDEAGIKSS